MVGAGLVALIQVLMVIRSRKNDALTVSRNGNEVQRALGFGSVGYIVISALLALAGGLWS